MIHCYVGHCCTEEGICKGDDGVGGMGCFFRGSGALGLCQYDSRVFMFSYSGFVDEVVSAFHVFCTVACFSTILTSVSCLYLRFLLLGNFNHYRTAQIPECFLRNLLFIMLVFNCRRFRCFTKT